MKHLFVQPAWTPSPQVPSAFDGQVTSDFARHWWHDHPVNARELYTGWARTQDKLIQGIPSLSSNELAMKASSDGWPVWAVVSHIAGARVYWLCGVFGEPGGGNTPFIAPYKDGWEDHLDQPRSGDELATALTSSWAILSSCLDRWTVDDLTESRSRRTAKGVESHTRAAVLTRLLMHDDFHCGEVSSILGAKGLPSFDPWEG